MASTHATTTVLFVLWSSFLVLKTLAWIPSTGANMRRDHPHILVDQKGWEQLLDEYSAKIMNSSSLRHLESSSLIRKLAQMERDGTTAVYTGNRTSVSRGRLTALKPLAIHVMNMSEHHKQDFFLCALWTSVKERIYAKHCEYNGVTNTNIDDGMKTNRRGQTGVTETIVNNLMNRDPCQPTWLMNTTVDDCVKASVAWAKVLLSHRAVNCAGKCPTNETGTRTFLWNPNHWFYEGIDKYSACSSLALTLDVLYDRFTEGERVFVASALALLVFKRSWQGLEIGKYNDMVNDSHLMHLSSNQWLMRNGHMYVTNLGLEGEQHFDEYVTAVLSSGGENGFNEGLKGLLDAATCSCNLCTLRLNYNHHDITLSAERNLQAPWRRIE